MISITKAHAAALATALGTLLSTGSAHAAILRTGESVTTNQRVISDGNRYFATLQADGNFVVYRIDGVAFWSTQTAGSGAIRAIMQGDGNFVLYTATGQAVWSSRTWGRDRVFGVDASGRAVVLRADRMKKRDRAEQNSVFGFTLKGASIEWGAPTYDAHFRPRPKGPHCIGNPRACGNDLNHGTNEWYGIRMPFP